MANLRLRLRNGEITDPLPGRCLFCGTKVLDLRTRTLQAGGQTYRLQLPLCDEDRKEGTLAIDHPQGTGGRVMDAAAGRSPILWIFWSLFQLFNRASEPRQSRNDKFVVIRGVCPEFLDALEDLREEAEGEDIPEVEEAAPRRGRRKSEGPGALPWILAGVTTLAVVFCCCGGLVVVGVVRSNLKKQEQRMADRSLDPPGLPGPIPAPAVGGGAGPQPPKVAEAPKAAPGEILPAFEGHTGNIVGLTYTGAGDVLISAGEDGTVRWWRIFEGKPPQQTQHQAAKNKLYGLALSPDGKRVAVTAWEGNVQLLDGTGARVLETLQPRDGFVCLGLAFAPDNQTLLTGRFNRDIKVWDVRTGKLRTTLKGGNDWTMAIAFSPDGKLFATTGGLPDDSITLWDAATQQAMGTLKGHKAGGSGSVRSLAFAPDSKTLASACDDGTARLWDLAGMQERVSLTHPEKQIDGVAFTPDGNLVVTGCKDGQIRIWDAATGQRRAAIETNPLPFGPGITAVAVNPDGKTLAAGCGRNIRRWDLAQVLAAQPGG
jgi:WD40 repeat protein